MKLCPSCHEEKPLTDFYTNGVRRGKQRYKPMCKRCECEQVKNTSYQRLTKAYGKPLECYICGYKKNFAALEFHHLNPKEKEFDLKNKNKPYILVEKEVKKCVCVCANCHRELHHPNYFMT